MPVGLQGWKSTSDGKIRGSNVLALTLSQTIKGSQLDPFLFLK